MRPRHGEEGEVLTREEHATLLRSLDVDQLLKLVTLEAKRLHDGHFAIFALTTHYKVAFGTPHLSPGSAGGAYAQLTEMPGCPTLKEALIAALVAGQDVEDYCPDAPDAWGEAQTRPLTCEDWSLIESVLGGRI
jgi:hypothetical protein